MAERLTRRKLEVIAEALRARCAGGIDEIEPDDDKAEALLEVYEAALRWADEEMDRRDARKVRRCSCGAVATMEDSYYGSPAIPRCEPCYTKLISTERY